MIPPVPRRSRPFLPSTWLLGLLGLAACRAGGTDAAPPSAAPAEPVTAESLAEGARLYEGFGNYHRAVSTASAEAQRWFDQGLQQLYGFNHDEAIRSFASAALADPALGMAWWGIAYAEGLHINNPEMSDESSRVAWLAAQEALARRDGAAPVEAALIEAVARRYAWPPPQDRRPLDEAYAAAMGAAVRRFPVDPDVCALYAEALMDLQPWDLWTHDGEPKGRTLEIVAMLERAIAADPDHPGANHFYIHAVEASRDPGRALDAAAVLADLVPGAGHLVHMPSHVYIRTGRYALAAEANERAIAADSRYFAQAPPPDFYSLYYVHNIHFLAYAAMMEGRYAKALEAARRIEVEVPESFVRDHTALADGLMPVALHVLMRFGRWEDILAEPAFPAYRRYSNAMRSFARTVALAALGRTQEARDELEAFEARAAEVPEDWYVGVNEAPPVLALARLMALGELLYREGDEDAAFDALRTAVELEEALTYDEPPGWMHPVRHALGALLLEAGEAAEAERVFHADLARHPDNGWSLVGLRDAQLALGRTDAAAATGRAAEEAWRRSDVRPAKACYCAR